MTAEWPKDGWHRQLQRFLAYELHAHATGGPLVGATWAIIMFGPLAMIF